MPSLCPLNSFVEDYRKLAFLVDFDGTMVDLVPDPERVFVPPDLPETLAVLTKIPSLAFAIITGRSLSRLDRFLGGVRTVAIGSHGGEFRLHPDAPIQSLAAPLPHSLRDAIQKIAIENTCLFEDKTSTLSLHLPAQDQDKDLSPALQDAINAYRPNIFIRRIGKTYEILQKNVTKGTGINHLMTQPSFIGRHPIYIGDDTATDESLKIAIPPQGQLIAVASPHNKPEPNQGPILQTHDVRQFLACLKKLKNPTSD
jgi:trehalose 6-phosphate phosphatase